MMILALNNLLIFILDRFLERNFCCVLSLNRNIDQLGKCFFSLKVSIPILNLIDWIFRCTSTRVLDLVMTATMALSPKRSCEHVIVSTHTFLCLYSAYIILLAFNCDLLCINLVPSEDKLLLDYILFIMKPFRPMSYRFIEFLYSTIID